MPRPLLPLLLALLAPAALGAAPVQAPRRPLPHLGQVRDLFAAGNYKEVLAQTSRALALREDVAAKQKLDRQELLRLKAQAHLKLGEHDRSAAAFAEAAAAAPDETSAAADAACELVLKRVKEGTWQAVKPLDPTGQPAKPQPPKAQPPKAQPPKQQSPKPQPPDLSDPKVRAAAFAALLEEVRREAGPRLKKYGAPRTLDDIYEALKATHELRTAELAAGGAPAEAVAAADTFAGPAGALLRKELAAAGKTYTELETIAWLPADAAGSDAAFTRGLFTNEMKLLRDVIRDCKRVALLSEEFARQLGEPEATGEAAGNWRTLAAEARALQAPAEELLSMCDYAERANANRQRRRR